MLSYYRGDIPIINDDPQSMQFAFPGRVGFGLVARDYNECPLEMFEPPSEMDLIEPSDYQALWEEEEAEKSSLEHLYLGPNLDKPKFVNLDQNGHGYCWAYSTAHGLMFVRMVHGLPLVRLNPHSVAAIIKKGRDEGGWCGLSGNFFKDNGCSVEGNGPGQWPLHSRDLKYDTPECRALMAKYKADETWVDYQQPAYDQNMADKAAGTALFNRTPCPSDYPWWGHSVLRIRRVRIEAGSFGDLIINSWLGWGRHGLGVIQGSKMATAGCIGIRTAVAA